MDKDQQTIQILENTEVYSGFLSIFKIKLRHRLYNGEMSPCITRELLERGQAVAVLLYDTAADSVVLIEQLRIGALDDPQTAWLLEIVAGVVENGESLEDVARRESEEEAGCLPQKLEYVGRYYLTPGGSSEQIHIFYAEIDSSGLDKTLGGVEDESEDIRVKVVPWSDVIALMDSGRITNATAMLALQWLRLRKCEENTRPAPCSAR